MLLTLLFVAAVLPANAGELAVACLQSNYWETDFCGGFREQTSSQIAPHANAITRVEVRFGRKRGEIDVVVGCRNSKKVVFKYLYTGANGKLAGSAAAREVYSDLLKKKVIDRPVRH